MTSADKFYNDLIGAYDRIDYTRPTNRPWIWTFDIRPKIEKVIFNEPATIVLWSDNTKTVVKCQEGDTYSKEMGLAMCIAKKYFGDKSNFNNVFKKWIPEEEPLPTIQEMREYIRKYCGENSCSNCVIHSQPFHKSYHCFDKDITSDDEIIRNYKVIKEWEAREDGRH